MKLRAVIAVVLASEPATAYPGASEPAAAYPGEVYAPRDYASVHAYVEDDRRGLSSTCSGQRTISFAMLRNCDDDLGSEGASSQYDGMYLLFDFSDVKVPSNISAAHLDLHVTTLPRSKVTPSTHGPYRPVNVSVASMLNTTLPSALQPYYDQPGPTGWLNVSAVGPCSVDFPHRPHWFPHSAPGCYGECDALMRAINGTGDPRCGGGGAAQAVVMRPARAAATAATAAAADDSMMAAGVRPAGDDANDDDDDDPGALTADVTPFFECAVSKGLTQLALVVAVLANQTLTDENHDYCRFPGDYGSMNLQVPFVDAYPKLRLVYK